METERKAKVYPISKIIYIGYTWICTDRIPWQSYEDGITLCLRYMYTQLVGCAEQTLQHRQQSHETSHQPHHAEKKYLFCSSNEWAENNVSFYIFMAYCREANIKPYNMDKRSLFKVTVKHDEGITHKMLSSNFTLTNSPYMLPCA